MNIAIIIVAAGKGSRAPGDTPKQYRKLAGKSVISHTLHQFAAFADICIVINPTDRTIFDESVQNIDGNLKIVHGGATRTDSVKAGLLAFKSASPDLVLIHDAARPFVSGTLIKGVIDALSTHKASVPSLPIVDAVKTLDGDIVDRDTLRRVQTPQGFHYSDILAAYEQLEAGQSFADDIAVARHAGLSITMTQGGPDNIKLTYPEDFTQAEKLMTTPKEPSLMTISGTGFDVHRIVPGDGMWLCGVKIEGDISLLGHSDADVGLHSLTDAIFGALALGDIGDHFPPSDDKWKGASSDIFLAHAVTLASEQGAKIVHADITLICEKPKVKPHRAAMRARISELLGLPLGRVSVKATTTEGLGFTGRAEGIAAQSCVTIAVPI